MMHYAPCMHQQIINDNQVYYPHHIDELPHYYNRFVPIEENNEQNHNEIQETIPSVASGERSSSADLFRLEFAATQWSKLVSNAEGLFNKLIVSNILPHTEQDQIEQWLCMKQEYEECITSDDTASLQGYVENARRSLEIIEEVTETDERTDESANQIDYQDGSERCSETDSELSEEDDDDDQSDTNSENPDFQDKLQEYMKKFAIDTDKIIEMKMSEFYESDVFAPLPQISDDEEISHLNLNNIPPMRNHNMRRNSMLPGSEMSNSLLAFNDNLKSVENRNKSIDCCIPFEYTDSSKPLDSKSINDEITMRSQSDKIPNVLIDPLRSSDSPELIKELRTLTKSNRAKQKEVMKIQSDLDDAQKQMAELQSTIEIKERFIADIRKNSETRASVEQRFQRRKSKLKEDYRNTKSQLAQAQSAFISEEIDERSSIHKKNIEIYENMMFHYQKRLDDIKIIKQIAGDSAKKIRELEDSLSASKKQMEELKEQLKKEESIKKQLEEEVAYDQLKIRELEEKYNLTASKLKEIQSESEEERVKSMNDSADKKNLLNVSARISHLDHVLKEKSMDLEKTADTDEKEALRHEIRNLRRTRDCLIDEKSDLNEKFQKEKTLTTVEERKLLECGETIEAIDAMIEHKNEMICGRKNSDQEQNSMKKGEFLMKNLEKLTESEMRNLFQTYFTKVIDLRENLKTLETQNVKLEATNQHLMLQYQQLFNELQRVKIQSERRVTTMQKEFEGQKALMLRHITENSSSSDHERVDNDTELDKYQRENWALRKRLQEAEAHMKAPATKITREKNKLIIQKTTDTERKKK